MSKLIWTTEYRRVSDLKAYEHNPRQINDKQFEKLKESISSMGYIELVAIDVDNTIIAGHMRIKALIDLGRGDEEIEVRVPNRKLTEREFKKYLIVSNKVSGAWNFETLSNVFDIGDLKDWGFSMRELGMSEDKADSKQNRAELNDNLNVVANDDYKKVTLYLTKLQYNELMPIGEKIKQLESLDTDTDLFIFLLNKYSTTQLHDNIPE